MTDVLVLGRTGQLSQCLQASAPVASAVEFVDRARVDIVESASVARCLDSLAPQVVINATAYTAVDKAERDEAAAFAVNGTGVAALARACAARNIALIHVSTDFVFDGTKTTPWLPVDNTSPLGIYGASKLAGEKGMLATPGLRGSIVRTSWLYSEYGNNFVKTMLRLMSQRDELGVVNDQIGAPTDALGLAQVLWLLAAQHLAAKASASPLASEVPPDIYHWSDDGEISWYDFATEIQRQARPLGLLVNDATLRAIGTIDYPTPARRPAYSVLNCALSMQRLGKQQASWQDNLRRVLGVLAAST
ncbi:MAG: dTDP-4-dehydrorhamnose reductase [Urechidicola sp.]|jgi:dTDP-4-dehydrorhamnose reductase